MERGRNGSAGVKDFGPSSAGAEKGKSPVCVTISADGLDESRRLCYPFGEQVLATLPVPDGGPEKLQVSRGVPGASGEVSG